MKKISLIFLVLLLCGCTAEPVSVIPSASSDPNKDLANITGNQADPKEPQEEKFYLNDFLSVTLDVSSAFEDYFENDTLIRDVLPVNNGYLVVYSARTSQNSDSLYYDLCFALYDQDGNYIDRIIFEDYIHMYSYFTFTIESDEFYFYGSNRDRYYKLSFDKEGQFLNEQEFRFNKDSNFAPIRSIKIGEHFYVLSQFIDRHDGLDHKDFELCKLDKNGNMIWSAPITAQLPDSKVLSAMTIQETEDQNILMVAGRYVRESLDFESLFYAIYGQDGKLIEKNDFSVTYPSEASSFCIMDNYLPNNLILYSKDNSFYSYNYETEKSKLIVNPKGNFNKFIVFNQKTFVWDSTSNLFLIKNFGHEKYYTVFGDFINYYQNEDELNFAYYVSNKINIFKIK